MERVMQVIELDVRHYEKAKDLLVDLQKYVVEIDKYKLNILSTKFRDKYFDYMLADCNSNQGKCFVCVDGDKVLGMVAGYVEKYNERDKIDYSCPKKGIIAELIVDKNYRKDGLGTKLVNHMENYFKSISCKFVQIDVFAYNESAKKFYYKNGYEDRMVTVFKKLKNKYDRH